MRKSLLWSALMLVGVTLAVGCNVTPEPNSPTNVAPLVSAKDPPTAAPSASALPALPSKAALVTPTARLRPSPTPTLQSTPTRTLTRGASPVSQTPRASTPTRAPTIAATRASNSTDPVLVGAGDIASCDTEGDEATASLLDQIPGTVFTLGDNAYDSGLSTEYARCYGPTWGRHKARTHPVPGNHDYVTLGAAAYFKYFGASAGDPAKGYYSYDLGAWHIVALNSEIAAGAGSPQEKWLRADLAAHPTRCTLAYWHKPRFSSGPHGSDATFQAFWQALYDFHADVVLSGHDHDYERFAPQAPDGTADPARGIREFVVGTGGSVLYPILSPQPNSELRNMGTWGVLKLTLRPSSYDWQFIPVTGKTFTDAGSGECH